MIRGMGAEPQTPAGLHPLVSGFGDAETYDRGRPLYGIEVARLLIERLGMAPGEPALELGAGTGQLSRALLEAGLELIAVEPLAGTRALLARAIGEQRARAGTAEQIPLPDDSVAAVFAADSFHWFDEARAVPEIRRVLRPRGGVAILRSVPVFETPWSHELGTMLAATRPEHPAFGERGAAAALEDDPAFGPVAELHTSSRGSFDRGQMLAWVASLSWVATLEPARREELLAGVHELLARHRVTTVEHEVRHLIWVARLA
jgi:SAM-dependent methyltransferase